MRSRFFSQLLALVCGSVTLIISMHAEAQDITSNLITHWKLDETSGTTASDSTVNGYDGTATGNPTWQPASIVGGGLDFESTDGADRIDCGTFDLTGSGVTLAAWIYMEDGFSDARIIIKSNSHSGADQLWGMTIASASRLDFRIRTGGTFNQLDTVNGAITPGQWHHVAGTYDGTTMRVYIDGVQVTSAAHTVGGAVDTDAAAPVALGDSPYGSRTFDGVMDDVRVYDRALTATDLLTLYNIPIRGHWKLDETSGTTVTDSSGFGRDGTLSGNPSWSTTAIRGGSLDLETTDGADRIDAGNFDVTGTGLTLTAWIRQEDLLNDGRIIMKSDGNAGSDQSWGLTIDENGELDFRVTAGGTWSRVQAPAVISSGTWHHIAGTYDGTTMRLYLDGQLIASTVHSPGGAIVGDSSHTVTLGDSPVGSRPFDGIIDDARIYSRTLSEAEIKELYGLVGHWKLNETSGTTAADSSGLGNDGTVNGTATWASAIYGNGLDLDYIDGDDYVEIPNSPSLENVQEENYSVAAWFKPGSTPPGSGADFDAHYGIVIKEGWHSGLSYNNANQFQMDHSLTGDTSTGTGTWDTSYPPGKFYHVAGVIDRSAGTAKIYVDGTLVYTETFTPGGVSYEHGTTPWRIGIAGPSFSDWKWAADGIVDDARIYSRALSDTEIKELYGLMGHWKLDETSGTVAADSSGLGNDGTYSNGPTLGECGPYEGAVDFDGIDDYIAVTVPQLDSPQAITVACWAKSDTATWNDEGTLVSKRDQFIMYPKAGGTLLHWYLFEEGATWRAVTYDLSNISNFDLRDWHHYSGTYDPIVGIRKLYVDGSLVASNSSTFPINADTGSLQIGKDDYGSTRHFDGKMDDVQIYDRALTEKQIADLYGLMGHWKLDETSGTVAVDDSPFGNDGEYQNGPILGRTGTIDKAVEFDGTEDRVYVNDQPYYSTHTSTGLTVSAWVKVLSVNTDLHSQTRQPMVAKGIAPYWEWTLYSYDWGGAGFSVWQAGGSSHSEISGGALPIGVWKHVVGTYEPGFGTRLYVDGVQVSQGTTLNGSPYDGSQPLLIGAREDNQYLNAVIDDVRIYHRILCPEEVEDLSSGGVNGIRIIKWVETL